MQVKTVTQATYVSQKVMQATYVSRQNLKKKYLAINIYNYQPPATNKRNSSKSVYFSVEKIQPFVAFEI